MIVGCARIRLGLVGLPEDIEAAKAWLNRLKQVHSGV